MDGRFRLWFRWAALALLLHSIPAAAAPVTYEEFVAVPPGTSLAKAIAKSSAVYLLPGIHLVENPIVIERESGIDIHGADRVQTQLVPLHPDRPLFVIEKAPRVNLTSLSLRQSSKAEKAGFIALETRNSDPVEVELQDCTIVDAGLVFAGSGTIRLQGTSLMPHGLASTPIVIDHPDARFLMVGGNISNESSPARFPASSSFHVWLKRGHLRMIGTGLQATHGVADLRIDSGSSAGPHVIANVRSEGNNGERRGERPSRLVYVPPSTAAVDVLLVANSASWNQQGHGQGALVDYSAAGTLWLIGNNGSLGTGALAKGTAPRATWVALGNLSFDGDRLFEGTALRKFAELNLYAHRYKTGNPLPPTTRFSQDQHPSDSTRPPIPAVEIPPPLTRPTLETALPGMLDVQLFGAKGDGITDDTDAIQAALDADCDGKAAKRLFLPAGTYRVKRPLRLNHRLAACQKHPSGGLIAGAGRQRTILVRDGGGGVFASEGLAYATVQGMTFRTSSSGMEAAFALENAEGVGHATQAISFYDVGFEGGRYALGIGLESKSQCSENLLVDVEFRNAGFGLAVGGYNALANLVYRGSFIDNEIAMGHPADTLSGGTWAVLGARVRGTRDKDLEFRNSANGVWYFHGLDSFSSVLVRTLPTGAVFPLIFDRSRFAPGIAAVDRLVDFSAAGGPIFLHSRIERGNLRVSGGLAASYAIAIASRMPTSGVIETLGYGRQLIIDPVP